MCSILPENFWLCVSFFCACRNRLREAFATDMRYACIVDVSIVLFFFRFCYVNCILFHIRQQWMLSLSLSFPSLSRSSSWLSWHIAIHVQLHLIHVQGFRYTSALRLAALQSKEWETKIRKRLSDGIRAAQLCLELFNVCRKSKRRECARWDHIRT